MTVGLLARVQRRSENYLCAPCLAFNTNKVIVRLRCATCWRILIAARPSHFPRFKIHAIEVLDFVGTSSYRYINVA